MVRLWLSPLENSTVFPLSHSNIEHMRKQLDRLGLCFSWDRVSQPFLLEGFHLYEGPTCTEDGATSMFLLFGLGEGTGGREGLALHKWKSIPRGQSAFRQVILCGIKLRELTSYLTLQLTRIYVCQNLYTWISLSSAIFYLICLLLRFYLFLRVRQTSREGARAGAVEEGEAGSPPRRELDWAAGEEGVQGTGLTNCATQHSPVPTFKVYIKDKN